jgi:hypothetical protein
MRAITLRGDSARARLLRIACGLLALASAWLSGAVAQESPGSATSSDAGNGWCISCDRPAPPGAITEVYKGRRITVCNEVCREHWHANRDALFASLQARGALFDEKAMPADEQASQPSLFSGWFWFGVWVLAGLICGAIGAYVALGRGLPPLPWLLAGLAFNVVALLVLATRPRGDLSRLPEGVPEGLRKIPATHEPLACARCGNANHPSARRCSRCGAALSPEIASEVEKTERGASR